MSSIKYSVHEGQYVEKGDELGYFAYGGSTLILLFQSGSIEFDSDLIPKQVEQMYCNNDEEKHNQNQTQTQNENEEIVLERLVKMGTSLGRATRIRMNKNN